MSYQSAHDLPSFKEMSQQLALLKPMRFLVPREKRPDIAALEQQLRFMADTVDRFYVVLGPRNWIFHEHLPVQGMADLLNSSGNPDEAERKLIEYYAEPANRGLLVPRINGLAALRRRLPLVQRAQDDYLAGRYYATVHVLLSVMDGFVNEFESVRRGLHARHAEELNAWDSVVGHHLGLTNAHKTFTKSKCATSDDPVFELFRNGIVHGMLLNYDNDVVATKAWNRLFAVMDWAKAREKEQKPPKPQPTWSETFALIAETSRRKRASEEWGPRTLAADDADFETHAAAVACTQYLASWRQRNYGGMAGLTSHMIRTAYGTKLPKNIRQEYTPHLLSTYDILSIDHSAPAVCTIAVRLVFESGGEATATLRWLYENEAGDAVPATLPGGWGLFVWGPAAFLPAVERPPA